MVLGETYTSEGQTGSKEMKLALVASNNGDVYYDEDDIHYDENETAFPGDSIYMVRWLESSGCGRDSWLWDRPASHLVL